MTARSSTFWPPARTSLTSNRPPAPQGASPPTPEAVARVEYALTESSRMLRSTITELHPGSPEQAGLARALRELAEGAPARAVTSRPSWTTVIGPTTSVPSQDSLIYAVARELLTNVVKHAAATTVRITLGHTETAARLRVSDDGGGIAEGALTRGLAAGHIGLRSQQLRVEAAGGTLTLSPARPTGTTARLEVPLAETNQEANGARSAAPLP